MSERLIVFRYSGSGLLGLLSSYNMNRHEVEAAVDRISEKDGWMTKYNVEHRFVMYHTIDF